MRKANNIFWGVALIVAAVVIIALQVTGATGPTGMSLWRLIAVALLGIFILKSLFKLDFAAVPIPGAVIYILCQKPLHLPYVSIWLLLVAAALATAGLSMLLGGVKRRNKGYDDYHVIIDDKTGTKTYASGRALPDSYTEVAERDEDIHAYARVRFGAVSKYLHTPCLESAQFESSFGALEVYFDQATLSPNGADIYLDCSLGAITLYIPKGWRVINDIDTSLAGVDEDNKFRGALDPNAPTLRLHGRVSLGGIELKYV